MITETMLPTDDVMTQTAPFPAELASLVGTLAYRPGWSFTLRNIDRGQGSEGLTLVISVLTTDSYHAGRDISVNHYMIVPAAAYDRRSWKRWLFEMCLLVDRHEGMEFFRFITHGDFIDTKGHHVDQHVERPYAPNHGPGNDPYIVPEYRTEIDRRMKFTGEVPEA